MTAGGGKRGGDGYRVGVWDRIGAGVGNEVVRDGRNCIRWNHIRERHWVLRNQLNEEEPSVERNS